MYYFCENINKHIDMHVRIHILVYLNAFSFVSVYTYACTRMASISCSCGLMSMPLIFCTLFLSCCAFFPLLRWTRTHIDVVSENFRWINDTKLKNNRKQRSSQQEKHWNRIKQIYSKWKFIFKYFLCFHSAFFFIISCRPNISMKFIHLEVSMISYTDSLF